VKRRFLAVLMLAVGVSVSLPLFAHHGNAALDMSKKVVMKGVVTDWRWQNPHSILKFDVKDDSGNVVNWSAEINNPADMVERGWTAHSIKIGDQITITVNPVKNGKPVGRIVQVVLPDGKVLNTQYINQQ
jgi:hypothetical protein